MHGKEDVRQAGKIHICFKQFSNPQNRKVSLSLHEIILSPLNLQPEKLNIRTHSQPMLICQAPAYQGARKEVNKDNSGVIAESKDKCISFNIKIKIN